MQAVFRIPIVRLIGLIEMILGALAFRGFIEWTNGFGLAFDLALSKDQLTVCFGFIIESIGFEMIRWILTFGGNTFATNPMSIQISSDDRFIYTSGENRICWFERNASISFFRSGKRWCSWS